MICFLFLVVKIVQISVRVKLLLEPSGNQRFQREKKWKKQAERKNSVKLDERLRCSKWMRLFALPEGFVLLQYVLNVFSRSRCSCSSLKIKSPGMAFSPS